MTRGEPRAPWPPPPWCHLVGEQDSEAHWVSPPRDILLYLVNVTVFDDIMISYKLLVCVRFLIFFY